VSGKLGRAGIVALMCAGAACRSGGASAPKLAAGGTASSPSPAPSSSSATSRIPTDLAGTFAILIASADVPRADEAGFWALTLSDDGTYVFGRAPTDAHSNTGILTVADDKVTFSDEEGEGACPGPGTYSWTREGEALIFTLVDDACLVRKIQTTAHPYSHCSAGRDTCVKPT
jgi:hypothetical protein